jgi:hypothetical protein
MSSRRISDPEQRPGASPRAILNQLDVLPIRMRAYLGDVVSRLADISPSCSFRIHIHHAAQTMLDSVKQSESSASPTSPTRRRLLRQPFPLSLSLYFPLLDPLFIRQVRSTAGKTFTTSFKSFFKASSFLLGTFEGF